VTSEDIFEAWAGDSLWSRWVKPVLFAHLSTDIITHSSTNVMQEAAPVDVSRVPRATGTTAIVVDLPGAASIATGLALAELGYRPVPLYNAVPVMLPDASTPTLDPTAGETQAPSGLGVSLGLGDASAARGPTTAVDMYPIVRLLVQGAANPSVRSLSPQAPPAFLLDSRRRGIGASCRPGDFDNRSISLPTDFPSANFMLAQRIREAIVLQEQEGAPQQDLSHTLRRWQEAGIGVRTSMPGAPPQLVVVPRPPRFRHMWYGLLARMGLRQNPLGGYGGFLPVPSAG
jgi:hypothetical protein